VAKKNLDAATICAHGKDTGAKTNVYAASGHAHEDHARKKEKEKKQQHNESGLKAAPKNGEPTVL
jgi:hypothetical protein